MELPLVPLWTVDVLKASSTPTLQNSNVYKYIPLLDLFLASVSHSAQIHGYCETDLALMGFQYKKVHVHVLPDVCADHIMGLDFQTQHQSITLNYGGKGPPLGLVCGLNSQNVKPPDLFANLVVDCHPLASKSHRYSFADKQFIEKEMKTLLEEGIIEKSSRVNPNGELR